MTTNNVNAVINIGNAKNLPKAKVNHYGNLFLYVSILGLFISQIDPNFSSVSPANIIEAYGRAASVTLPKSFLTKLGLSQPQETWVTVVRQFYDYPKFAALGVQWLNQIYSITHTGVGKLNKTTFAFIGDRLLKDTVKAARRGTLLLAGKSNRTLSEVGGITLDILRLFLAGFSLIAMYQAEEVMNKGPRTQLAVGLVGSYAVDTLELFIPIFITMCNSLFARMLTFFRRSGLPPLIAHLRNTVRRSRSRSGRAPSRARTPVVRKSSSNLTHKRNKTVSPQRPRSGSPTRTTRRR